MYDHLVNIKNGYELHLKESTEDIFNINRSIEIFKIFNETQGTLERDRTNLFDEFTILCDMRDKFEKIGSPQTKFIINEYDKMYNKYFNKFRLVPITGFMNSKIRERDKLLYNDTLNTIQFQYNS